MSYIHGKRPQSERIALLVCMYKENLSVKCLSKHYKYFIIFTVSYYTQSCTMNIFPFYPEDRTPENIYMWASHYKKGDGHIQLV